MSLSKKIYKNMHIRIILFFLCFCTFVILLIIIYHNQKRHNEEGFTPKITGFYNSNLRKVRNYLETNVFESNVYKRGAVPFLRYFSIY